MHWNTWAEAQKCEVKLPEQSAAALLRQVGAGFLHLWNFFSNEIPRRLDGALSCGALNCMFGAERGMQH